MHKQLAISIQDLRFVTILCRQCNTKVTLDLDVELDSAHRAPFRAPTDCPRCHAPFDSAVPRAVDSMQRVYKAIAGLGNAVSFTSDTEEEREPTA